MQLRPRAKARTIQSKRLRVPSDPNSRPVSESFETLVDELSAAMARVPANEIDAEVEKWLRAIVLALGVDRGTVWELADGDDGFISTCWWARPGIPGLPPKMRSARISPRITAEVLAGRTVVYSGPEEIPKDEVQCHGIGPQTSCSVYGLWGK
jgi:hypothetical protein